MTLKSGTSQACAACKYQRRKCTSECQLAPYFPPDKPKMFLNAHKLFGVSNILKILKKLKDSEKSEAMRSIIYQSNVRAKFPVRGCEEVIEYYCTQIKQCEYDIQFIHSLIAMCHQQQIQSNKLEEPPSELQLGMTPFAHSYASENYSYSNSENNAYNSGYVEAKENHVVANPAWIQHPFGNNDVNNDNNAFIPVESQMPAMQEEFLQEYDEMKPYFDSSPESSMADTMQSMEHVTENELKTAAACFSLTSVN